jgi:hypothetical protein
MICIKFLGSPLTREEHIQLKEIDNAMLWYDLTNLLSEKKLGKQPEIHIDMDYTVRPFEEVEEEYLKMFHSLMKN